MTALLKKEFSAFLNSLTGYLVIGVFLLGQKYFGWGSEPIRILHDLVVNGRSPESVIIDSGVDVVTADSVDEYERAWQQMAGGR